jgi:hypothetical protein
MEGCREVATGQKSEIRNPKSEGDPKSEIRMHKVVITKLPSIRFGLGAEPTSDFAPRKYRTE